MSLTMAKLERNLKLFHKIVVAYFPPIIFQSVLHVSAATVVSFRLTLFYGRFQWSRGLRSGSAAARLQGLRVRIPPAAWLSVSC